MSAMNIIRTEVTFARTPAGRRRILINKDLLIEIFQNDIFANLDQIAGTATLVSIQQFENVDRMKEKLWSLFERVKVSERFEMTEVKVFYKDGIFSKNTYSVNGASTEVACPSYKDSCPPDYDPSPL
ncbi:hypothetical protein F53441_9434 [Fusarium austroafricanum]|uniref:Uncharacterized protein n=1 Tax=Fusarium austroafricanum TaxID=2364996 RepID=A0A8H4KCF4_9HYPO|nr:hypothetical protein F53441_9434 [Fusarium austroafricanum]